MKKTLLTTIALSLVASSLLATNLLAQNVFTASIATNGWGDKKAPFFDKVAGKFNATATIGYVYNFARQWDNNTLGNSLWGQGTSAVGYGARIGWLSKTNFGLSFDYLGFASKWKNHQFDITNNYNVVAFTPSYRFSFGKNKEWGLKLGLGLGFAPADVTWTYNSNNTNASGTSGGSRVAGGATYATDGSDSNFPGCQVAGNDLEVVSDSLGGAAQGTSLITLSKNQCLNYTRDGFNTGPSDKLIADRFRRASATDAGGGRVAGSNLNIGNTGVAGISPVSYGVWRRLFATAPTNGSFFATGQFDKFETAAEYVTRCGTAAAAAVEYNAAYEPQCVAGESLAARKGKEAGGFVLIPEITAEYDNGFYHAEVSLRYIHELVNVTYKGQTATSINQFQKPGPLAIFLGIGGGVNF